MKCLVTGGTGFIGRVLCRELSSAGARVTLLGRHSPAHGSTHEALISHDFAQPLPAELALHGIDTVYHLAGVAHRTAAAAEYEAINYRATVALAQAAARAGVKRFIFLSSVKAAGELDVPHARAESEVSDTRDAYGASKWNAEVALRDQARDGRMQLCVLRPALVYAARAPGNFAALAAWVRRGLPAPPECGGRSMVSRDDLVRLLVELRSTDFAQPATWNVTDGEVYSTRRLCIAMAQRWNCPARLPEFPLWLWRALARAVDMRRGQASGTTARALFAAEVFASDALLAATTWRPADTFERALAAQSETTPASAVPL